MEDPTPFSLNEVLRRWRAEFGSPSSLNATELEELEAHLRDHVAQLEATGMTPEAAFAVAMKQLGDRQRVATEFAKINPQRVWLERATWMVAGIAFFYVLSRIAAVPADLILNHGCFARWNPVNCATVSALCGLAIMAILIVVCGFAFARRPGWFRGLAEFGKGRPLLAGVVMVLALWEASLLVRHCPLILERYLPRLNAWLFTGDLREYPWAVLSKWVCVFGVVQNVLWTVVMCALGAYAVRTQVRQPAKAKNVVRDAVAKSLWLERALWMVAGWVFVRFVTQDLHNLVLLPVFWLQSALGRSVMLQHLLGFAVAILVLAAWALPFWVCWFVAARQPRLADWAKQTFRYHPVRTSLAVVFLLNAFGMLGLVILLSGVHAPILGGGLSQIPSEWHYASWKFIWCVAPAVLLITVLRWRVRWHAAN